MVIPNEDSIEGIEALKMMMPIYDLTFCSQAYMEQDSLQRAKLQLAIQAYQDIVQQRQQHQEDVKAAHGL